MANPRVAVLTDEFTLKRSAVDTLDKLAADESRDLTDSERTEYELNLTRMEAIEKDLDSITKREARFDAAAATHTRAVGTSAARTAPVVDVPSIGEQLLIRAKASIGKDNGELETLTRALAHGVSGDGIAPVTVEGDLIKFVDANRYAVNAARRLPMPDNHAPTFLRPRASQFTTTAVQAAQGDVLSSRAFKVVGDTITKATYGSTLALSEQEIDWTDPALLSLAVQDMAQTYAVATDTALTAAIVAAVPGTHTILSLTPTAAQFIAAVGTAAGAVYTSSKSMPDTLFVSVDRWVAYASIVDTTGRPLFPIGSSFNAAGSNGAGVTSFDGGFSVMGLRVVVDPTFASATTVVAASQFVEVYEQDKGQLTIAAPSTLETIVAYRGYFATNVYAQGLNGLAAT